MTSTIKVNTIQNTCGADIIKESSNTITIGASGDTVTLASGASQSGFGRTGTVDWQTGSIKTANFTASNGEGYFVDTTSSAITMTLPSGSSGSIVSIQDYNKGFDDNSFTITPASGQKINGGSADGNLIISTEGQGLTFVYVDSTVGWKTVHENEFTQGGSNFITASGGTITTSGNCRIHTFTSPGTFTVCSAAACAANNVVSHLIVAGGGAGATYGTNNNASGGGGGGGFREVKTPVTPYTASPLDGYPTPGNRVTVSAQAYPIVVGAGGAAAPGSGGGACGSQGSNSSFGGLTSAGGGAGSKSTGTTGINGGSGGGAGGGGTSRAGGTGNTPPVTPAQGQNGGGSPPAGPDHAAGGGGGATEAGVTGGPGGPNGSGRGGAGATTNITGSPTAFSGGGGGSATPDKNPSGAAASPCGTGSAGGPQASGATSAGTTNRGGGSGGAIGACNASGSGGSGIVVIRYKFQ
jgi:hypothetical protein